IPAGTTVIAAPGVEIVARSLMIDGGDSATLQIRAAGKPGIQVTTASISGSISVSLQAANGTALAEDAGPTLALSGVKTPQVLTVTADAPTILTATTRTATIADTLHVPWAIVALEASSAIAGVLVDEDTIEANALAADMLRWVTGGCYALL